VLLGNSALSYPASRSFHLSPVDDADINQYDISDPAHPRLAARLFTGGSIRAGRYVVSFWHEQMTRSYIRTKSGVIGNRSSHANMHIVHSTVVAHHDLPYIKLAKQYCGLP